jgi:hypothetical protein
MKFNNKLVWFVLFAPVVAVACATGSKLGDTATDGLQPPKQADEPTEPPPEHVTAPPPAPTPPETSKDAGTDAATGAARPDASTCANLVPGNACVIDPQCGCATGETCDITDHATGAVSCISAGEKPLAATCVTPTQCAQGLTCADGVCRPWCSKDATTCTGTNLGACRALKDPAGTDAKVCTIACDLNNPSAVCGENNCLWNQNAKATDCHPSGTRKAHERCSRLADCAPGLTCIVVNQYKVECEPWCRIGHREDCGAIVICRDVYGAAAPVSGDSKLGHCQ